MGIACREGNFVRHGNDWEPAEGTLRHVTSEGAAANTLPQIAALLDASQFQLISESGDQALLIQGVAGSGKTTVALHRLAWLVGDPEKGLDPARCIVIVLSRSLKAYVAKTLPELGVNGVPVIAFVEWLEAAVVLSCPHLSQPSTDEEPARIRRPDIPCPSFCDRIYRSMAMLRALEEYVKNQDPKRLAALSLDAVLLGVLKNAAQVTALDETRLIDAASVNAVYERARVNSAAKVVDRGMDALLVRLYELLHKGVPDRRGFPAKYDHVFADEVQDLSPVDLACVLGAASDSEALTIVGDTAQKIDEETSFPGWEKLRKYWSGKESLSRFVSLDLSYRSTVEIIRFADHIRGERGTTSDKGRRGRVPIWFRCLSEERGIQSAQEWLTRAVEKYPSKLTAVVCRDSIQAKHVLTLLRPAFGPAVRSGDDSSFSFEGGIVVTHASQVRGMEFTNVLLWNPSKKDFPADSTNRNLLYLAASRARDNLCLVTWGRPSELLPSFRSTLVRAMDIEAEEREEQERELLESRRDEAG